MSGLRGEAPCRGRPPVGKGVMVVYYVDTACTFEFELHFVIHDTVTLSPNQICIIIINTVESSELLALNML